MYDPYEDDSTEEYHFEFELRNSHDGKIVTLVCSADRELTPMEYAEALREFADRIDSIITMTEVGGTLN